MDYFLHFITNAFGEVSFGVMTPGVGFAILLTLVLLGLSGFASGAEIAFFSLSPSDISELNVSNVHNMYEMFYKSSFNQDISNWKINKNCDTDHMFTECPIKEEYKPKALQE